MKAEHNIEILAPAGDAHMLRAAVFSGADCVYLGLSGFNARRSAANFDEDGLAQAVAFCHARNCKVYVALNTLVFAGAEDAFCRALSVAQHVGCDAAIVQDLAVVPLAKKVAPKLALHASTQMSVHSLSGVQKLAQLGFSRVVLARELREEEIACIAAHAPIELEVFVHGALCLSVSGQCYFSAFLGGRSGNRGGCAAPCRLPFCTEKNKADEAQYALSLKDLSLLKALPRLREMGVSSAKIEGRLRTPEYCAAVVNAAAQAREGLPYDEGFLREVFSRGAFTRGWYGGGTGQELFGFRSEEEVAQTKKALPKARELYRRERARVPVSFFLSLSESGLTLAVSDGTNTIEKKEMLPLSVAQQAPLYEQALGKTGGTPFYVQEVCVQNEGDYFAPAAVVNRLRRDALEELLAVREQLPKHKLPATVRVPNTKAGVKRSVCGFTARFSSFAKVPPEAVSLCEVIALPLSEACAVPEEWRKKTRLVLPRFVPQAREKAIQNMVQEAKNQGFLGFEVHGLGQWNMCEGAALFGGFGLNVANATAANFLHEQGFSSLTVSPEVSAVQLASLSAQCEESLILEVPAYGHFPLMLTRACPLRKQKKTCATCSGGFVYDRKGATFTIGCENGVRSLYNPVPLWLGDRLPQCEANRALLYFTEETPEEVREVLVAFSEGKAAKNAFTRGLFERGTQK